MDLRAKKPLFDLMDNLEEWRIRSIERITYASTLWVERTRIIHATALKEVLDVSSISAFGRKKAWVRLPITAFPKKPLVDLNIEVGDRNVYRMPRLQSGSLTADYLLCRKVGNVVAALRSAGQESERLRECLRDRHLRAHIHAMCRFRMGNPTQVHPEGFVDLEDLKSYMEDPGIQNYWTDTLNAKYGRKFFDCSLTNDAARNPLLALPSLNEREAITNLESGVSQPGSTGLMPVDSFSGNEEVPCDLR